MLGQRHAKVVVMGLGSFGGGVGAARFWANLGSQVTVTDLKPAEEIQESIDALHGLPCRFVLGEHREADFAKADLVVVNPAVKPGNRFVRLARAAGARITTEIGTVFRLLHGPTFGVTGSSGKSTTTALLGAMLAAANPRTLVGGNLGGSLLDRLAGHPPTAPVVLELSSFQLHYLAAQKMSPCTAVVTNLAPNHLDWHGSVEAYYAAKENLIRFQYPEDVAVLNAEDPVLRTWARRARGRVALFARDDPDWPNAAFVRAGEVIVRMAGHEETAFPADALRLPGAHNLDNALAATAAAYLYARDVGPLARGAAEFTGLPHRLEHVATVDGVAWYNDSIATTPESAIAALRAFSCPKVLIAGGSDKGSSFEALGREIAREAHTALLLGATAPALRAAVEAAGGGAHTEIVPDLATALRRARACCPSGGVVLLSPACASYDLFRNFQDRGDQFRKLVLKMVSQAQA